eukprot:13860.XXX_250865_249324_1 [CDS] Oithona nana genome sequencing.
MEKDNVKMMRVNSKVVVEVAQNSKSIVNKDQLKEYILQLIRHNVDLQKLPKLLKGKDLADVSQHVDKIRISSIGRFSSSSPIHVHFYKLNPFVHGIDSQIEISEEVNAAHTHLLPSTELEELWESLLYDSNIKEESLRYVETAMIASECNIDPKLIGLNRLMLFYGPPGTGKTSLCKALAQKVSIMMSDKYDEFQFVEINSHSLFSKWFSESGKLVQKMFDQLLELLEEPKTFLFVLIDEVESLTMSRKESKNEPSDALRVVNALLTQIDQLKSHRNVLVLATSNLKNSIDEAFLDRADVTYEVNLPSDETAYEIFHTCINEFKKKGIIEANEEDELFPYKFVTANGLNNCFKNKLMRNSLKLLNMLKGSKAVSARSIRKKSFQALMKVSQLPTSLFDYLTALEECYDEKTNPE